MDTTPSPAFAVDDATSADRFIMPNQAAVVIAVRCDGDDDVVDIKVVFADGTTHDNVPTASQLAIEAAHALSRVLCPAEPSPSDS